LGITTVSLLVYLLVSVYCRLGAAETEKVPSGALTFNIDPSRSAIQFSLGAILHTVHGTFRLKSGTIHFDAGSGKASGQITVDVQSGNTGEGTRDRQMHANVLESDRFPDAVFYRIASMVEWPQKVNQKCKCMACCGFMVATTR
jgi:polyisoprenoid-binding protein YceI